MRITFSQNVALHFHARQLSTQPGNLHLLGTHLGLAASALELALSMVRIQGVLSTANADSAATYHKNL